MRKWYMPLTVLGLGGMGILLLTERGRDMMRWLSDGLEQAPERLAEWNDAAQEELDYIQDALNRIAESIEPHPELGQ